MWHGDSATGKIIQLNNWNEEQKKEEKEQAKQQQQQQHIKNQNSQTKCADTQQM